MDELTFRNCRLVMSEVFKFLENCTAQYDFIFAGPPYALQTIDELPKIIITKKLLAEDGIFVLEHTPRNKYESYPGFVNSVTMAQRFFHFSRVKAFLKMTNQKTDE